MMDSEVRIDGSKGEGGGQMLRTSLTLSAAYGKPFEMLNIRANRDKPGLKRQHLTCVRAVVQICNALHLFFGRQKEWVEYYDSWVNNWSLAIQKESSHYTTNEQIISAF